MIMSHRERCMTGVFNKILIHLGLLKGTPPSSSSPQASASASCWKGTPPSSSSPQASASASCCCGASAAEHKVQENAPPNAQKLNVFTNKDAVLVETGAPVKPPAGFRVRVSVPAFIEPFALAPVVIECTPGSGGVQGLQWYSEKLMMDEDGDVAQEFLDEVVSQASAPFPGYTRVLPSFKTKMKTRPAKLKGPVCTFDGNVVQSIESSTGVRRS